MRDKRLMTVPQWRYNCRIADKTCPPNHTIQLPAHGMPGEEASQHQRPSLPSRL